jgi:hypothetical protein
MEDAIDIFLSHNSKDKPIVRELRQCLIEAGHSVWLDEKDLIAGRPWHDDIERALLHSSVIIVTIGVSGLGPWETAEMRAALIQMVRRQTPVIPLLLPGAPDQVELPLFLQTLKWVDCRKGFDSSEIEQIGKSVGVAKSSGKTAGKPVLSLLTPPAKSTLADFWRFIADFQSVFGWALKASFAAPLIPVAVGFGPPWDGTSPLTEKATVVLITAIVQLLAVTGSFFILPPMRPDRLRRVLAFSLGLSGVTTVSYLCVFVLLTEVQPDQPNRMIVGWWYSDDFYTTQLSEGGNIAQTKMDMGHRPLEIYESWTVWISLLIVLFTWLAFFSSLVFYVGLFVKNVSILQRESVLDDRALVTLGLSQSVLRKLHSIEVHTVGDLCAMSERQLRFCLQDSADEYALVESSLKTFGINLRSTLTA